MQDDRYRVWLDARMQAANEIKIFRSVTGGLVKNHLAAWTGMRSDTDPLTGKPAFTLHADDLDKIAPDYEPKFEVTSSLGDKLAFDFAAAEPELTITNSSLKLTTGEGLGDSPVVAAQPAGSDVSLRMHRLSDEPDAEVSLAAILSAFEETVFKTTTEA